MSHYPRKMSLRDRIRFRGADFSTHLMLDDVALGSINQYSSSAFALAGYINGIYETWNELVKAYASTGKYLLSIDVLNMPSAGAQCLDIETGDASIGDAPAWTKVTAQQGALHNDFRYYPKLYTSMNNLPSLVNTQSQSGIPRNSYMIWSAHYTQVPHICGPNTPNCGSSVQADATQWTSSYMGISLDASLCFGYFFAGPPKPAPIPEPELWYGSSGPAVRLLQSLLNMQGASPQLATDGIFGVLTKGQVMAFQRRAGLVVDGIVGPKTWAALGNYT